MKRIPFLCFFFLMALNINNLSFSGTIIVDQEQPNQNVVNLVWLSAHNYYVQSFQPSYDNIVGTEVKVFYDNYGGETKFVISLFDKPPWQGGSLLAKGYKNIYGSGWIAVYWAPVTVIPNTTYYLAFQSICNNAARYSLVGHTANPYPRGYFIGTQGTPNLPHLDATFRTFS